jgi:diguanylate cyclase (GGDEF)-like protein/PAS domain S-box-containing protein
MESSQFRSDNARGEDAFRSIRRSEPAGSEPPGNGGSSALNTLPGQTWAGEQPQLQARLLDAVGQAIIATDLQGTVTYWNRCAEQLYGWSAQEVAGRTLQQFLISADYRENMVEIMADLRVGRSWSGELVTRRKDGTTVTVEITDTPVQDDRGRVVGIVGTWTNITERRAADARLRETERRLLTLLSNTPAMVYRCLNRPDWPEEYVSEYALELTGYPASAFMDRPTLFGDLISERDKERIWDEVQEALERCERFRLRYTMHHRDGGLRFVEELGQGVYDESGNVAAVEGLIYDVTDRERVEMRLREAENRYRTLVERIPAIVYTQEPHEPSRTTYVSPQNEAILGYSPEQCLSDPEHWIRITHPEDRERVLAEDGRTNQSGEAFAMEYRQFASDGRTVWIRDEATLVRDEEGNPLYWLGVQTDVTERKRAEAKHREAEVRYRSLVEHVPVAIYRQEIEHNGAVTYISPQIEALTGYAPDEYADPALWIRTMHPEDRQRVLDEDKRTDETGEPFCVEFRKFTRDGRLIWLRDEAVLVRDGGGAPLYWQGVVQDITERKALEEQLEHQALHDSLTDLPNRALFIDRLRHALMRTKRRKDGMVAVLFMDLDGFKDVNDSMGHEAGDLLLVVVAERLRRCLRPEDTLARFGGDEFVVLIEDAQGPDGAVRLAERITTELKKPFSIEGKELFIAASIGIALGEDRTKSPEEILRDADTAMYRAKDQAADYSVFDPAMYLWAVGRLELQNDLRRAAERNEFILHYQPIVSLEDGTIQGVEALVRWVHPERGILNPTSSCPWPK